MTDTAPVPLTEAEQAQLADLQARQQAVVAAETAVANAAKAAALKPVIAALGSEDAITTMLTALKAAEPNLGNDTAGRVNRICIVLGNESAALFAAAKALGGAE